MENLYSKLFIEYYSPFEAHLYGIKKYLVSKSTQYQNMEIIDTYRYGKCLFLDGKIQSAASDEFIYHEMLVFPAIITHPNPKKVLIIGGGEGATLREVLKCKDVESVKMIDIDKELVDYCKEFLPEWADGAFEDKRVCLLYTDARKHLEENNEKFDVIIIDLTEPMPGNPSYLLFTKEFYKIIIDRLNEDGIITLQAGNIAPYNDDLFTSLVKTLNTCFKNVFPYSVYVPSFQKLWGFIFASNKIEPLKISYEEIEKKTRGFKYYNYYNADIHFSSFSLPTYLKQDILNQQDIISDKSPKYIEL